MHSPLQINAINNYPLLVGDSTTEIEASHPFMQYARRKAIYSVYSTTEYSSVCTVQ